jgi:hypothetical protein
MNDLKAEVTIVRDGGDVVITATPGELSDLMMPAVELKLQEMQKTGALDLLSEATFRFDFERLTLVEGE